MNPLAVASLISFLTTFALGIFIYAKNPNEPLNRLILAYSLGAAYWAFTEWRLLEAETFERMYVWHRLGTFWPVVIAIQFHLALVFIEQKQLLAQKIVYLPLYGPPIALSILDAVYGSMTTTPVKVPWGWHTTLAINPLSYIFITWIIGLILVVVPQIFHYYKTLTDALKKTQLKWFIVGILPVVVIGGLTNIVLPRFQILVPVLTTQVFFVTAIINAYAVVKYELFSLTPATAAENIIATISDYLFLINLDGIIERVNQTTLDVLGYNEPELIGSSFTKIFADKNAQQALFDSVEPETLGSPVELYDFEISLTTKAGRVIPVSLSNSNIRDKEGRIKGMVYIGRDITERQRAKEELEMTVKERTKDLRQTLEQLQLVTQNVSDFIFTMDSKLQFTYVNPTVSQMFGYSVEEMMNLKLEDLTTPISGEMIYHIFADTMRDKLKQMERDEPRVVELELVRKDGSIIWVELTVNFLWDVEKQTTGILGVARDITTRRLTEEAKRDLDARRAAFIMMTSHELRTPLTSIRGFSEILENRLDDLSQRDKEKCFEVIKRNIKRLERLITGVTTLNLFERETFRLELQVVNFCELFSEALEPYQTFLGSQLKVIGNTEGELIRIECDRDRILQILDNLLDNAIKQTLNDDRIIHVSLETHPAELYIRVTDNGAGIAPENLESIFEPFRSISTQFSAKGSGVGLYLSRQLAEAHGGSLIAQSEGEGQGATFVLNLPRKT